MKNKLKTRLKNGQGITLLALAVTIVILIILAGVTIGFALNDNGIIKGAKTAKEQTEIDNETSIVKRASTVAIIKSKYGTIDESSLKSALDDETGEGKTVVSDAGDYFEVMFIASNRYYQVDENGTVGGAQYIIEDEYAGDITKGGKCDGSEEKPYEISCIEDLVAFSIATNGGNTNLGISSNNFKEKYVILTRTLNFYSSFSYNDHTTTKYGDINTDGTIENIKIELTKTEDDCVGFEPINDFQGNFDGGKNEIQNIYINRDGKAALMININSYTTYAESIKNLGITGNITSKSNNASGIITGMSPGNMAANIIENCWNKANIKTVAGGTAVAGICVSSGTTIQNCYNEGNVINEGNTFGQAGGIVAGCGGDNIINCYNTGNITGINVTWYVGGIASGHGNNKTIIKNSYNRGKITGGRISAGGILGHNGEVIENCYNSGDVSQGSVNGGIVGQNVETISNCYNIGKISGNVSTITDGITELSDEEIKNNISFIETLNNNIGTNTEWKRWKIGNDGYPAFAD